MKNLRLNFLALPATPEGWGVASLNTAGHDQDTLINPKLTLRVAMANKYQHLKEASLMSSQIKVCGC